MKVFLVKGIRRIVLLSLAALLSFGPLGVSRQQGEGYGVDELVIHAMQFLPNLSSSVRQHQINYGFDAVHISVVPIIKQIISEDYLPGTSFDLLSSDVLTCSYRGPPRSTAIL